MFKSSTRHILMSIAALAALSTASVANAQMRGNFEEADADHDGKVTLQEFQTYATQQLKAHDGPMAQRFKQLSPDQQAAILQKRFEKADSSHKGFITQQDWSGS